MKEQILLYLGGLGITAAESLVAAITKIVRAEGDVGIAKASLELAIASSASASEIQKRTGTLQAVELERDLCREDLLRMMPWAQTEQAGGVLTWAASYAMVLINQLPLEGFHVGKD